MKTVNIPAKACPVVDEVDVLVVGGGAAGIGAAIGAAPVRRIGRASRSTSVRWADC